MDLTLTPAASGKYIADNCSEIRVNQERIEHVARMIVAAVKDGAIKSTEFRENPLHPQTSDDEALNWVLLMDAINFSFWPADGEEYAVTYRGERYTGYMAASAALNKAIDANVPILTGTWMKEVTEEVLDKLLKSDSGHSIPMLKERVQVIRETGERLLTLFGGQFRNAVQRGEKSAQIFLRLILQSFPSFNDFSHFQKHKISLLKRAQILVWDVYSLLHDKDEIADFKDIGTLTMFADYRVPQVLAYFGALEYSPHLREVLESRCVLSNGDPLEVQLRGCSIHAVERITEAVKQMRREQGINGYRELYSADIDVWLWLYRREHAEAVDEFVPHHRTRSIYY